MKRNYYFILISVALSAVVHLFILLLAYKLGVFSFSPTQEVQTPSYKLRLIKPPVKLIKNGAGNGSLKQKNDLKTKIKKKKIVSEVRKIDLPANMEKSFNSIPYPKNIEQLNNDNKKLYKNLKKQISEESFKLPKIITVDGDKLPDNRKKFNRIMIPKLPRDKNVSSFSFNPDNYLNNNFTPDLNFSGASSQPRIQDNNTLLKLPFSPETALFPGEPAKPMDLMIDVVLYKYPLNKKNGFFRIDLKPNKKASALRTFRKDVIFLLDISGSIGRARLEEMKQGIFVTLETLHPQDRFNIIAFSSINTPLFKVPMHPDKKTITAADEFLFKLRHRGTTNIFSPLNLYIGDKFRAGARPLIVYLISDGNVNSGAIVNSSELINKVSNINHDGAHIFTFSCGEDKNSFLMDLLAYRNRGESRYVPEISNSHIALSRFIFDVADVKVCDLDYQVSSELAENTFPKRLEDLYKGKTLSVYGYYPPDTKEIALRITGRDSSGIRRELVFNGKLANAPVAKDSLPSKWAEQLIYHLYSILTVKYDPKIRDEIIRTANEFNLNIPYLDKHIKPFHRNYQR
jgi:uncharacterized protein YegL